MKSGRLNLLETSGPVQACNGIALFMSFGFWLGNLRERDHLEDPGVDGRIILSWILRKCVVEVWTASSRLRMETGGGHL
jgi:hypothetical protein